MGRVEELREKVAAKVATFSVGDTIVFHKCDETGCTDATGDPIEIELNGKIISIDGQFATVEHKYGICQAWLAIADYVAAVPKVIS